jgi:hypothetical protein
LDDKGLYHGLHLYTDNPGNIYTDTNSFLIGYFQHGLPTGEWKDYCKDGSFSIGAFSVGGGITSSDGQGGWVTTKQGIYVKIGLWKYFMSDSSLYKTEYYDRQQYKNGWANTTYLIDTAGNRIMTKYESKFRYQSILKREITREYTDSGILSSSHHENFWRNVSTEHYENGRVKEKLKCRKILGVKTNRLIYKLYSIDGKLVKRTKGKCLTSISHESW